MTRRGEHAPEALGNLTPREVEVLRLAARGLRSAEIAARLEIAVPTVKRHLTTVYRKLGVENRVEATTLYFAAVRGRPRDDDLMQIQAQLLERAVQNLVAVGLVQVERVSGLAADALRSVPLPRRAAPRLAAVFEQSEPASPTHVRQWARTAARVDKDEQLQAAFEALAGALAVATALSEDAPPA
jgi:DNA-binding CsgD family transcriptional regulator